MFVKLALKAGIVRLSLNAVLLIPVTLMCLAPKPEAPSPVVLVRRALQATEEIVKVKTAYARVYIFIINVN